MTFLYFAYRRGSGSVLAGTVTVGGTLLYFFDVQAD